MQGKIAKNTLMLYFRMLLSMVVTLYTSRIVLNTLGIVDFGVYNIVAGVIVMFGFLNNAMTASTQRFLTYEKAKDNLAGLKKIFNISITIHLIIAVVILLLAESIGLWFLNTQLNIPDDRMIASNWVYQFSVISFVVSVYFVPYNAVIIANEKMNVFALLGIAEVALKLVVVFMLLLIDYDKLIVYSCLLLIVSVLIKISEKIYCSLSFDESKKNRFEWDSDLMKEMGDFAGWNLFGVVAGVGYSQGINIFLNIFFGTVVNASRGIAFQIQGAVSSLITNFQIVLAPVITKNYARNEYKQAFDLVFSSSKLSIYLLLIFSIPLIIETESILMWWLKVVPPYSVIFTQLIIVDLLISSLSGPLHILVQATGNIKRYQILVSGLLLLNVPFSYLFLKLGYSPEITISISIFFSALTLFARLFILHLNMKFPVTEYLKKVVFRILVVTIISWIIPYYVSFYLQNVVLNFLIIGVISLISILMSVLAFGLDSIEKKFVFSKIRNLLNKQK
ncbi:lipopolysaccharide biosynthesis protein [Chryseobacterium indoltheticum]|uniref:lipopolysaccharide biosynthesis protein n=1 Tax=Chryseobacterium indoltheticum TaxID=254 RepID=UPI004042A4B8